MATTFVSTDTLGAGTQFTFIANGDGLVVLPGATLGSTTGFAFSNGGFSDLEVTVLGTLVSRSQLILTGNSSFVVGAGGNFVSYDPISANAGIFLNGAGSVIRIEGSMTAQETIAILTAGGGSSVSISGSVSGASGVFLGLNGSVGDGLVNEGQIAANAVDDAAKNTRFNNAVFTEGANTKITNLAGGVITATSSEGNGVRLGGGSNGSIVTNHGTIISAAAGVDISGIGAGQTGALVNTGLVQGFGTALMAQAAAGTLLVTNSGQMIGDVVLGQGNDVFDGRGGRVDGRILGGLGNDRVDLRGASVTTGGVEGAAGSDTLIGGGGDDRLFGGADADDITGGAGDDTIAGDDGALIARGGDGDDRLSVGSAGNFTEGHGGAGQDSFQGGVARDDIFGGEGDDEIFADGGDDNVAGGSGDDLIDGFEGADSLAGGAGDDRIVQAGGAASLMGGAGDDTIVAGADDDVVDGGRDDDLLAGEAGRDTVSGGWGQDSLTGGNDDDVLDGGGGEDDLKGGLGNDRAAGGFGADVVAGEGGRDTLAGDAGDDTLVGGASGDLLTGGAGADVFLFAAVADSGVSGTARDTVADFTAGVDHLDLRGIDARSAVAGDQAFSYIGGAAFGGVAGQLRYAAATGVLSGDLNGDRVADFAVFLQGRPMLGVADIFL